MARNFDAGAEVSQGGGGVFKNPEPGDHEAVLTGVIHVGSFQDVFKKGNTLDPKKPANFVLLQATLMGEQDKNEDGSRMVVWKSMSLKSGDKSEMTALLTALDPKELAGGFDDLMLTPFIVNMKGSDALNQDGTPKFVNWKGKGFAGCPERLLKMIRADVESEGITAIGHIKFADLTRDVLDAIPAHLIRQYFLSEGLGNNLSYAGSHVEALVAAARADDPEWKVKKEGEDESESTPENKQPLTTQTQSVPAPENIPAPAMDEGQEY